MTSTPLTITEREALMSRIAHDRDKAEREGRSRAVAEYERILDILREQPEQ